MIPLIKESPKRQALKGSSKSFGWCNQQLERGWEVFTAKSHISFVKKLSLFVFASIRSIMFQNVVLDFVICTTQNFHSPNQVDKHLSPEKHRMARRETRSWSRCGSRGLDAIDSLSAASGSSCPRRRR